MFSASDTIVAIATAAGRGGIGVVRIAGPDATNIATSLSGRVLEPRKATVARLSNPVTLEVIDQVVLTWFQAPRSFTGDDVVEVAAHGSPTVLEEIVRVVTRAGARLAEPGEFTFRAYLNGRIDLVQAEAVADLVNAVTPAQARMAMDQLGGTLTSRIQAIDKGVFDVAARLEASLDFPDEGFHFISGAEARAGLLEAQLDLAQLLADSQRGRVIREGRSVAIAGRPNVGKSSVFNALVGNTRAIVTAIAGTTRDLLIETIDLDGVPVTLVDTAGVRETADVVEREGVRLARAAVASAAVNVLVLDGSTTLTAEDESLLSAYGSSANTIVVVNKNDLPLAWSAEQVSRTPGLSVSAASGAGLADLRDRIRGVLLGDEALDDRPAMSNLRHVQCAETALASVTAAMRALDDGAAEEVVLAELQDARRSLEALTGARTPDDVLEHIFSHFCVGK